MRHTQQRSFYRYGLHFPHYWGQYYKSKLLKNGKKIKSFLRTFTNLTNVSIEWKGRPKTVDIFVVEGRPRMDGLRQGDSLLGWQTPFCVTIRTHYRVPSTNTPDIFSNPWIRSNKCNIDSPVDVTTRLGPIFFFTHSTSDNRSPLSWWRSRQFDS